MILGRVCSWSTLQCGQVKSEYRSMRKGAAGLPTLLPSGPAARQGSIRASARANIFILLCYTKHFDGRSRACGSVTIAPSAKRSLKTREKDKWPPIDADKGW